MPGPGYHRNHHHQPAAETRRRTSSNSPPRRAPHDTSPYGGYTRRRVGIPTPVRPRNTVPVLTPLRSTRNDSRPHSSSDSRPRVSAAAAADLLHHAYSTTSHGRFLNPPPPASSNPFSNGPAMTARATGAAAEQTHTNARKGPSFEPSSQLRSRSSDWRAGGGGPVPSSLPTSSSPGPGPTITTHHRPSSAASSSGAATSSHHHHLLINSDETANGSGEGTLFSFSNSPPHPMRTDIIDDRPEIHAPTPSRLKPWKDILATRSDMLGLDKPPPRPLQRPPVPRKDSPHQGA